MRRLWCVLAIVLVGLTALVAAPSASAASLFPWPIKFGTIGGDNSFPAAFATSIVTPNANPSGANDWSCRPSATHPYPVVLVHGTVENAYDNWNGLSPILKAQGYCVYALNYGNSTGIAFLNGTGDMIASAQAIGPFVNRVLASTGATKVDLIGHSQGGALIRYYTDLLGGASKVRNVIGLAPSNHPTTLSGITTLGAQLDLLDPALAFLNFAKLPALTQQAATTPPSPFYQNVNGNGETVRGVTYTNILTKNDEIVTPYTQGAITAGPGATVHTIVIQNVCSDDQSEHLSLPYSKNVAQIVLNTLDPGDVHPIFCYPQAPLTGNTQLDGGY